VLAEPESSDLLLADLITRRAQQLGDRTFLRIAREDRALTFADLRNAMAQWQRRCEQLGTGLGTTVALAMRDPLEFSVAYLSLIAKGRWVAPLDPDAPAVGAEGMGASLARVRAAVVFSDFAAPAEVDLPWLPIAGEPAEARQSHRRPALSLPGLGGVVLSSSGTTGPPKVINLGEQQLLATARQIARNHELQPDDCGFNPLPLFHINAEVVGLLSSLVAGAQLVLDDRFHRTGFWQTLSRHEATWLNAVPAIIARLAERAPDEPVPSSLRFVRSASAPLPADTLRAFETATGVGVLETYGMTEAASQIAANPLHGKRKPGSVGRPVGVEVRVVPEPGEDDDAIGHIEIRGPSVIAAYADGHHADRFDSEGWLKTGDLGYCDPEGYLYLVARVDDVINRGGEKVYPRAVEEAILQDPRVATAAVIGRADPVLGQVPVAYVVLHGSDTASPTHSLDVLDDLRTRLSNTLARSWRPVELRASRSLPAGATGKVQRKRILSHHEEPIAILNCR
jgi:acyl-CoA synthetase (AMP-forming)/AMP-acid ligase II